MPLFLAGTGTRGSLSLVAFSATWDTWRPLKASAGVRREWGASAERGRRVAASCLARGARTGGAADAWAGGHDWRAGGGAELSAWPRDPCDVMVAFLGLTT